MTDRSLSPRESVLPRRRLLQGSGAAAASVLLAACSNEEAPPAVPKGPTAAASATPVASAEQLTRVVSDVSAHVSTADQAHDPAQLAPRVIGSAAEFRTRSYEILAKIPEIEQTMPTPGPTVVVPVVPTGGDFPRTAIAVVPDAADASAQYFMPLQQGDARSEFATWGWARQLGGVTLPSVARAEVGAGVVAPDAQGLVMSPQDALARYAAFLSNGDAADPDDKVDPDPFQQEMHRGIQDERAKLNPNVPQDSLATIHEEYTVAPGELAALRTADGGALVIGSLRSSRAITVVNGATLTSTEPEFRLAGPASFTKEMVRDYGETVALFVPTADSGTKIHAIGATKILLGAHGS